jgi:hypothetical protein
VQGVSLCETKTFYDFINDNEILFPVFWREKWGMSMRMISIQIVVGLFLLILSGTTAWAGDKEKGADILSGTGTIKHIDLEGGFYGLIADDGQKYLPKDLAREFKVDGLHVRFQVKILAGVATIYMWGTPVEVFSIERLQ